MNLFFEELNFGKPSKYLNKCEAKQKGLTFCRKLHSSWLLDAFTI